MAGTIRTIQQNESLDSVWEEAVYTEARLLGDSRAENLAPAFAEIIARIEATRAGQYASWRREIAAQARVDAVNADLDAATTGFGHRLFTVLQGSRTDARWRSYFKGPVSRLVKLGLASQLEKSRTWPTAIRGEPDAELHPFAAQFERHIADGDAAVEARGTAAAQRAQHRVREIVAVIDDLNGLRVSTLGRLLQRATKNKLSTDWAEGFFRRSQRQAEAADDGPDDDEPAKPVTP
ncbi:MAG: hypothetical protein Q8S73_45575 [Deltaproteobacteria bacterium]|nr:hypothetical protein [Myxococcales bacterium]MDP3221441.1 hypothetical protein [Deltaproteobacteria bacterium]